MVYEFFDNPFPYNCGNPYLDIPLIIIYDRPQLDKRDLYTPDLPPAAVSVNSEDSVGNLTKPSDSPQHLLTTSYDTTISMPQRKTRLSVEG